MGGIGKKLFLGFWVVVAMGVSATPVHAATIGYFGWKLVDPTEDEFLFCNPDEPCVRFYVENVSSSPFLNAVLGPADESLGDIDPGVETALPLPWPYVDSGSGEPVATLSFTYAIPGQLEIPVLQGDIAYAPLPITLTAVPEPATLGFVAFGIGALAACRRMSPHI